MAATVVQQPCSHNKILRSHEQTVDDNYCLLSLVETKYATTTEKKALSLCITSKVPQSLLVQPLIPSKQARTPLQELVICLQDFDTTLHVCIRTRGGYFKQLLRVYVYKYFSQK
jgi:hypothetical protein